jgi:hypothetical protein
MKLTQVVFSIIVSRIEITKNKRNLNKQMTVSNLKPLKMKVKMISLKMTKNLKIISHSIRKVYKAILNLETVGLNIKAAQRSLKELLLRQ